MKLEEAARLCRDDKAAYRVELAKLPEQERKLLDADVKKVLAPDSAELKLSVRNLTSCSVKLALGIPQAEFLLVQPRGKA